MILAAEFWGQTVGWGDLWVVGLLVLLEGVLSIDNALVLGLLAKRLPKHQQPRALTYGLVGAFVFRLLAIGTATFLLKWRIVKLIGGGYLLYIAIRHLLFETHEHKSEEHLTVTSEGEPVLMEASGRALTLEEEAEELDQRMPVPQLEQIAPVESKSQHAKFWPTVLVIELTDIAFAIDSILAAIALVGSAPKDHPSHLPHPKLWVIIVGGILGVILMRFAAVIFIKLLERFPRFETAAYLLVAVIGAKLFFDWLLNTEAHPHVVDFHDWQHPAFWMFWIAMVASFCVGFLPKHRTGSGSQAG